MSDLENVVEPELMTEPEVLAGEEPGDTEESSAESIEAVEFVSDDQLRSLLESLLFSSDRPLTLAAIKQVFAGTNIKTKDIKWALERFQVVLAEPGRGVVLEEVGGGYQLRTKLDNADFLRRSAKGRPFRLSGPALEVLSIVAYRQPCTKADVDAVRGVESGHLLRGLMEKGIVNFAGKSEAPGKPMLYGTSRKFLELFGLRNLQELPSLAEIDELMPEGIGDVEEKKESLSDVTAAMAQAIESTYSKGEEELTSISDQLDAITTSTEFFEDEKRRQKERKEAERAQDIRDAMAVGEAVEEKDRRWLERYEAKLAEATASEITADEANADEAILTETNTEEPGQA